MQGYPLKINERKVLGLLIANRNLNFREIAKEINLNEVSVRRLHNKLKQENVFHTLHIPNFSVLGYKIMMVQRIYITSPFLIETKNIMKNIKSEWINCIDCHETYDGKIIARSVWRNAEEFKSAHAGFYKKFGTDWLQRENIDMIPLDGADQFIRINGIPI
ncbi:winged helix-turn-helix domain-containing protein [Candidatus Woesearchaeota archaeon]|nr:winged helix-turn-helix domain-containing protein [Candidatus Woesearchaeota archaeon]